MLPQPISADNLPTFEEALGGEVDLLPTSERETHIARVVFGPRTLSHLSLDPYPEIPNTLTDGEFIYYSVAADIPPVRKTIGRPKKVNRVVWVRGTFDLGRPATRWEPSEGAEPINPDGDGVFRSLTDAVIYSMLGRKFRSMSERAWSAEAQWDERYVLDRERRRSCYWGVGLPPK